MSRSLRILVVSDPPAAPGYLPRVRYLCDYLMSKGHQVTWLTEQYEPLHFEHTCPIITIPMYSGKTGDWFIKTVWTLLTDWHNRVFAQKAITNHQSPITNHQSLVYSFPLEAVQSFDKIYRHAIEWLLRKEE